MRTWKSLEVYTPRTMALKNTVTAFHFPFHSEMAAAFGLDLSLLLWLFRLLERTLVSLICTNKISNKELTKAESWVLAGYQDSEENQTFSNCLCGFWDERCSGFFAWHVQVVAKRRTFLLSVYCISNQTQRFYVSKKLSCIRQRTTPCSASKQNLNTQIILGDQLEMD